MAAKRDALILALRVERRAWGLSRSEIQVRGPQGWYTVPDPQITRRQVNGMDNRCDRLESRIYVLKKASRGE